MAPFITVFCHRPSTPEETELVKLIEKFYSVFIDSEITPATIHRKYVASNAKFFARSHGEWVMYQIDDDVAVLEKTPPSLVITFDLETDVSDDEWEVLFTFIKTLEDVDDAVLEKTLELIPIAQPNEKLTVAPLRTVVKQNNEYMFSHFIDEQKDICICEIYKPFTELPYTCVIENYSVVDFVPLFTSLFVCSSWGVAQKDILFLKHLWNHLGMKGEFDLENRLLKAVEECKAGAPEPRVYRETLEQVKAKDFMN